tara:strand:- start:493 stop:936 length:444 start_codon:yes stop_codon:yes gene_type:complete
MPRTAIVIREATEAEPHTAWEKKILKNRAWRASNGAHIIKYRKQYYQDHREDIKEYAKNFMREYYASNPDIKASHAEEQKMRSRAKKLAMTEEEIAEAKSIKETRKTMRKLVNEVAHNNGLIQYNKELQEQIEEAQLYLNSKIPVKV